MGSADKELTDEDLKRLLNDLTNFEPAIPLSDVTVPTFDPLDEADAFDRFKAIWSDDRAVRTSVTWPPTTALTVPSEPFVPTAIADDESEPPVGSSEISYRVALRSTKRKARRFAPNCFGSQFLLDPDSDHCGSCKFLDGCKAAVAREMPILEAEREARRAHFRYGELPAADPVVRAADRKLLRGHYLAKFRSALKRRRDRDKTYQQVKRANRDGQRQFEREYRARRSALQDAIARGGKDKFLEQLRGREDEIMPVWEAEQLAILAHGPNASAAQVAAAFNEMMGTESLSRHQARTRQGHIRKLEQMPRVWRRFVKASDDTVA